MAEIYASSVIVAPADRVWARIRDFNGLPSDVRVLQDKSRLVAIMKDGKFHKAPDGLAAELRLIARRARRPDKGTGRSLRACLPSG